MKPGDMNGSIGGLVVSVVADVAYVLKDGELYVLVGDPSDGMPHALVLLATADDQMISCVRKQIAIMRSGT